MKFILAGTPEFSVPIFEKIILNFEVIYIISQPDKAANRGYKIKHSPVKELAQKYNIKILQPEKIGDIYEILAKENFDIFLTVAYGQYIPSKILNLPKLASLNIHGSLLPKYRGASPIQMALLNGDQITGLSLIYMSKVMDAGDIVEQISIPIEEWDNSETLFKKLSIIGSENIIDWLLDFEKNDFSIVKQNEQNVSFSSKLRKEDSYLDIKNINSDEAIRKIKAFAANPGCWTFFDTNKRIKLLLASKKPHKQAIAYQTKDGLIYIYKYQKEGKKVVDLSDLLKK